MTPPTADDCLVMTALLETRPGKRDELRQVLGSLVRTIAGQPGCVDCMASQGIDGEGGRFHIRLVWRDHSALRAFLAAEPFHILAGALGVLAAPARFQIVTAARALSPADLSAGDFTPFPGGQQ